MDQTTSNVYLRPLHYLDDNLLATILAHACHGTRHCQFKGPWYPPIDEANAKTYVRLRNVCHRWRRVIAYLPRLRVTSGTWTALCSGITNHMRALLWRTCTALENDWTASWMSSEDETLFQRVTHLALEWTHTWEDALVRLLAQRSSSLAHLRLRQREDSDASARAIHRWPCLRAVEYLNLFAWNADGLPLVDITTFPALTTLSLHMAEYKWYSANDYITPVTTTGAHAVWCPY